MKKIFGIILLAAVMLLGTVNTFAKAIDYSYDPHNLSNYDYRTVTTGGRGALVFQTEPGGSFLSDHSFYDGDKIYVNLSFRERGYALAYDNGTYGFVDASYISWSGGSTVPSGNTAGTYTYDPHNITNFVYKPVVTGGRGALIFQTEPGGSFLTDHKFYDGDFIYVNETFREKGYALAYEDGTYGYVDASYINFNWSGGSSVNQVPSYQTPSYSYDPHTLSDFAYRTVYTGGRGALVFQTEPAGSFLSDHSFYDGDSIYVNLYFRERGYALAYDNGTYGFVDASYISW